MVGGDHGYSISERMRFAGHFNPNFFKSYHMNQTSIVGGQGGFVGQELCRDYLEESLHWHPQLW